MKKFKQYQYKNVLTSVSSLLTLNPQLPNSSGKTTPICSSEGSGVYIKLEYNSESLWTFYINICTFNVTKQFHHLLFFLFQSKYKDRYLWGRKKKRKKSKYKENTGTRFSIAQLIRIRKYHI